MIFVIVQILVQFLYLHSDSIRRVLPTTTFKIVNLLLRLYWDLLDLTFKHLFVGLSREIIAPVVVVVGKVTENVTDDLWDDVEPWYLEVLFFADLREALVEALIDHILLKCLKHW